ncbi:MAG: FAD synthase [Candidatus Moranbacteria bacterium GW2011_GWE1_35_17]|nr:MAG: FAD synthase [Candidatus Moranbacteria bacterium GW2011_GWE2_35_164]KKP69031.1 MAG: FAD synthase [Candidatus Moranbacteria bacterium GW2011_GWE1_35_17]KKP84111.1 MAG: FAD synthase [Candidatus Moranbacteria bacterium GW2011_GWF1_35_5]
MVFGTFDIFHNGHIDFLKQAKKYGNYLIVIVARDKTVKKVKGEATCNKEKNRTKTIQKSGLADKIVLGGLRDKYAVIKKYKPAIICLGYDQKFFIDNLKSELNKIGLEKTEIIRLKAYYPQIYKSSKLKNKIIE